MNNLHQAELGLKNNLMFFGFVLLILIIILLAVRIYFYKQNVNYLEKEIICLEKNRGIPILGEEIYTVKKLEMSTLPVSPKGDWFNPVINIDLLEEAINKLYATNNILEDKIEELRTEKESLINEVEKLLMELGDLFSYKEKE
ncbi:hypothetical protein BBX37_11865 [Listeria monocytogenes]|nr:hypothetical protein [Listeria monocytogenes]EAG1759315.1 hypothetical protein [Listeria monocytogenes]ECW8666674.1 hypothetical protein [Listeria monocytogenes]